MISLNRARLVLGLAFLAVAFVALSPSVIQAQKKKAVSKQVTIPTYDGVTLSGTLYPNPGGKRDAVVVFLHHFDKSKGGSSADSGWADLAAALQEDGYTVLAFDFRGFGDSKEVNANKFWGYPHNTKNMNIKKGAGGMMPTQIRHESFHKGYFPYLVNDVAAIKAYLDRRNDAKELNSGNIIFIGAGDGAAVGSLWLAHASRLRRDKAGAGGMGLPTLADPEIKDVAATVWLSQSAKFGTWLAGEGRLKDWSLEYAKQQKVPTVWVFGKSDGTSDKLATSLLTAVKGPGGKAKDLEFTGKQIVPGTKLTGAGLLDKDLGTIDFIVKKYLPKVLEDRKVRERIEREPVKSPYYYTAKGKDKPLKVNKKPGEDVGPVDLSMFKIGGP